MQSADEMVLAGSVPNSMMSPLERLHKQTSNIILATSLMIVFLVWDILRNFGDLQYGALIVGSLLLLAWYSFKTKQSFGIILSQIQLGIAAFIFSIFGFINLLYGLEGSVLNLVLGGLMVYMTISSFRRIKLLNNAIFVSWYMGFDLTSSLGPDLNQGEILAMCPNCSSILAIQPGLLSKDDKCPNCEGFLVNPKEEE